MEWSHCARETECKTRFLSSRRSNMNPSKISRFARRILATNGLCLLPCICARVYWRRFQSADSCFSKIQDPALADSTSEVLFRPANSVRNCSSGGRAEIVNAAYSRIVQHDMVVGKSAIITELQQQNRQQNMFKVPSRGVSSCSQQPDSSTNMSGKRSWQEAFPHQRDSVMARETMLGLSCGERPQQKPKVPQLTIFYAGAVNVYDNVPEDMVKALMTLAASKSSNPAQPQPNSNNTNSSSTSTGFRFPVFSSNPGQPNSNHNSSSNTSTGFRFPVLSSKPGQPSDQPNNNNTNSTSNTNTGFRFPVFSSKPGQPAEQQNNNTYSTSNTSTGFRFPVLSSKPGQPADQPNSKHNSSSSSSTGFKFPVLEQTSSVQGRLNKEDKAMAAPIPATKISPLPGLPQARRASIQRFLEIRKHKQASNSSEAPVKSAFDEVQVGDAQHHFLARG